MGRNAVKGGEEEVGSADGMDTREAGRGQTAGLGGWREAEEEKDVGAKEVRRPASAGILRKRCCGNDSYLK